MSPLVRRAGVVTQADGSERVGDWPLELDRQD